MKRLLLILLCLPMIGFGQEWEATFLNPSYARAVQQTTDGGYIITGEHWSNNWEDGDVYLLKVNNNGMQQWVQHFSGAGGQNPHDFAAAGGHSVQQTSDGGYIIAGAYLDSTGSSTQTGGVGALIKTDVNGSLQWEKVNNSTDYRDVVETTDGGFIIATSNSNVLKTDINGNEQWSSQLDHYINGIIQTSDGGYVACGYLKYNISGAPESLGHITKINNSGGVLWHQIHGDYQNVSSAGLEAIQQTSDGGYIITGNLNNNTDNSWLIKVNSYGYFEWEETFNGLSYEGSQGQSIDKTSDGGYIITGSRTDDYLYYNVLLTKTDGQGNLEWEKTFDDAASGQAVQQTSDGGYIIAGGSSNNNNGINETYLIKTNSQGNITSAFNIPINPNRKIQKTVNVLGKQIKAKTNTPLIEIYDDGTVEKRIIIE